MILLVSNTAWSIYNFRQNLVRALLEKNQEVTILAPMDACSTKLSDMGCRVYDLPLQQHGVNPFADLFLLLTLYHKLRQLRPKFIIFYTIKPNIYGSIAAAWAGIPCLVVTTGLGYTFINQNWISRLAHSLFKIALRHPLQVWFLNYQDLLAFTKYRLVAPERAHLLPGEGIDLEHFSPRTNEFIDGTFHFLMIARIIKDKGVEEYVEAARRLKNRFSNITFQLLGNYDTNSPNAISKEQISEWQHAGIIEYLGTTDDVRPYIAYADCVVLPSYREGIPRALIEASAMERPVIATDVPGCRDAVIDETTGLLCKARNAENLAEICERMAHTTEDMRKKMGQEGRKFVAKTFDEKYIVKQYIDILNENKILI